MPAAAAVPPALAGRVFRGRDAVARGWLTPRQLQACVWRRLLRGVYADAVLAVNHGLFISAAALVIPPEAAIAGRSAAWLWGADASWPRRTRSRYWCRGHTASDQ